MISTTLSAWYGAAATWRRRWYAADASRTRALARPVISVGNLRAGGSGKTPLVAHLAAWLVARGERPAILSRGYARRIVADGVTVVSDGQRVLADLDHAGDEPLLLARAVPAARVLVAADRHLAGALAESQFHATVHLLDDGFQHLRLRRTVDLLIVDPSDLDDRVIPAGHLREPLATAAQASAIIVAADDPEVAAAVGRRLGAAATFRLSRVMEPPRTRSDGAVSPTGRVLALAAIARPERFFDGLRAMGFDIAASHAFRDHHPFTRRDVDRLADEARRLGVAAVVTTEKDAVRLEPFVPLPFELWTVPLAVHVQPADDFETWLASRLAGA